jgi:hypothetical protein
MVDVVQLAQDLAPYGGAAIVTYGATVLTQAHTRAADATVEFGRRLLLRLTGRTPAADSDQASAEPSAGQLALAGIVEQLATAPDTPDATAVLRFHLEHLLRTEPALAAEVAAWHRPAAPTIGSVSTSGERSPAVGVNYGTITTGDTHPHTPQ